MSALVASASSTLAAKLSSGVPTTPAAIRSRVGTPRAPRIVESSSNLDDLFSTLNSSSSSARASAADTAAASVPAGFVRKNGVLRLTSAAEASAALQSAEAAPVTQAPDLLAAIGASTALAPIAPTQARKLAAKGSTPTAGAAWFNFSRPSVVTSEMKRDLQLLSLRAYMDPKKFYKKESKKKKIVPTFFQMGTVIAGAQDFYSSRLSNRERSQHYIDPLVNSRQNTGDVKKMKHYLKRKTIEVQKANQPAPRHFNKKRKQMEDASKRPGSKKKRN